jgi:CRISPR/Cas system type I-B associated protein Csh2 (Cas7 group RAMP superfamily)
MDRHGAGMAVGRLIVGMGRRVKPLVPMAARRWMDQRLFGAIFQATRVTNDNYGYGVQAPAESAQNG